MPSLGTFPARIQVLGSTLISVITLVNYARAAQFRVDNMDPAIRYEGPWEVGPRCNVHCLGTPDPTKIYGGTWHAAKWESTPRSLEYTFNGTEIAIYGIVVEARDLAVFNVTHSWNTSLTLNVDGMQVDSYQFHSDVEDLSVTYIYDTLFLTGSNLSNTPHTARIDLVPPSQFLFDYLVFTTSEDPSQTFGPEPSTRVATRIESSTSAALSVSEMMTYLVSGIPSPPSQATSIQPGEFAPFAQTGPIGTNSPTVGSRGNSNSKSRTLSTSAIVGITASAILLILFVILLGLWRRRNNRMETRDVDVVYSDSPEEPKRERWSRQAKTYFPGTPTGFIPGETYMNSFTESETGSSRSQASEFEVESNSYPKAKW